MNGSAAQALALNLDAVDYDAIEHLNVLFPHPTGAASIDRVSQTLGARRHELSSEIQSLETAQAYSPESSLGRMQSAQAELAQLFRKIETVQSSAMETEHSITSMTADIKRLDGTKRHLTLSMTALKRLQMLTTAYEQLRGLARARQYRECAGLLQAVLQLMKHFNSYRSIQQIATLSREVSETQRELLEQVCEDFEMAFTKGEVTQRRGMLVEACLVMDALGETARVRLVNWYVNTELREYRQVFRGNDEAGSLDNIDRRYSWFRRTMKTHEEEHAGIFPASWRVNEVLATSFCDGTRDDFRGILERSVRRGEGGAAKMDVNLLLRCLQETLDFEQSLEKRFGFVSGGSGISGGGPRASIDTLSSASEGRLHSFSGLISVAFEPYLSLWVESQDRQLAGMMPKYRSQPLLPSDEEFSPQAVMTSAIELFHFYKLTLSQCAKLSTSERLLDLTRTFAKYLDEYAQQVLLRILQGQGIPSSSSFSSSSSSGPGPGPGAPALKNVILVLNTADFWHINTNQLEENIKKRIDPDLVSKIDLSSQSDSFLGVASTAVLALVRMAERECEGAWREMRNTNWSSMDSAGDESSWVGELTRQVSGKAAEILALVAKPQYARAFCDNLVEHLTTAFVGSIVQCRPISEVGAQQMLVDKYALTKSFGKLLLSYYHNSNPSSTQQQQQQQQQAQQGPPAAFVRRVEQCMSKMDPLLKTLQVRQTPPEGLVQAYLIHIADRSDSNFKKILELKGVRRQDQAHLMELFGIHRESPLNDKLAQSSPLLTSLVMSSSSSSASSLVTSSLGGGSGVGIGIGVGVGAMGASGLSLGAGSAIGGGGGGGGGAGSSGPRFDAGSLGEKLLNAARDIGSAAGTDRADKATINENLRSFGNFFKRDIGGLGVRFGMGGDGERWT